MPRKAVILLSGGLDSTTVAAIAKRQGYELHALSFSYGQKHKIELEAAKKVAKALRIKDHRVAEIDLTIFQGSALTSSIEVPKDRKIKNNKNDIPVTYVPARNTIFLAFALAFAESIKAFDIFIGVNALDYSGYPDCRPEYIKSFEKLANLATAAGVKGKKFRIHTPLIKMTKAEIIKTGMKLKVNYGVTISCYDPGKSGKPCGKCDSCQLRAKGFKQNKLTDPVLKNVR